MLKKTLLIGFMILLSVAVVAQRGGMMDMNEEERVDFLITKMTWDLDLTEDQISKIKPILETNANKMEELKEKYGIQEKDREKIKEFHFEAKKLRLESMIEIRGHLNEEQAEKFQRMGNREGQHGRKGGHPCQGDGCGDHGKNSHGGSRDCGGCGK